MVEQEFPLQARPASRLAPGSDRTSHSIVPSIFQTQPKSKWIIGRCEAPSTSACPTECVADSPPVLRQKCVGWTHQFVLTVVPTSRTRSRLSGVQIARRFSCHSCHSVDDRDGLCSDEWQLHNASSGWPNG